MAGCFNKKRFCFKDTEFIKSVNYAEYVKYAFRDKNGKKYAHQYRVKEQSLKKYKRKLHKLESKFNACENFDQIYELFKENKVPGIGHLTVYDIALRMSQNCNIFPEYVYLHAGTREGAINAGLISKNDKKEKLTLDEIVSKIGWLKGTKPYLIEDYLCIYKENINKETLNEYLSNTKTVKKHKINTKITKNMNCNNNQKKFK